MVSQIGKLKSKSLNSGIEAAVVECKKADEVIAAFTPVCRSFDRNEGEGGNDYLQVLTDFEGELSECKVVIGKAAAILSENIIAYCLKAFVESSDASNAEKAKRRGLLTAQMAKISDKLHGQTSGMIQPVFLKLANEHMIKSSGQGALQPK